MRKRCKNCRCFLDPDEWCDCEEQECIDTPHRPVSKKPTIPPMEWDIQAYIQQKWLEFDMR